MTNIFRKKILHWIEANLGCFDPRKTRKNVDKNLQIKAFVELVFLYNMFGNGEIFHHTDGFVERIQNQIDSVISDIDFRHYSIRESGFLAVPAIIEEYRHLRKRQVPHSSLALQLETQMDQIPRKTAYRLMDIKYSLEKAQYPSNLPTYQELYKQTTLGKSSNWLLLSDDAAYSITHTLFYITDMGRKQLLSIDYEHIATQLFRLLVFYQLKNNLDILSELIICLFFLQIPFSSEQKQLIDSAMQQLYTSQDSKKGFVPSPSFATITDDVANFFEHYHTTLVALGAHFVYEKRF